MTHALNDEYFDELRRWDPVQRRWWLLVQAMDKLPLPEAIDLAQRAELFLMQGVGERSAGADIAECESQHEVSVSTRGPAPDKNGHAEPEPPPVVGEPGVAKSSSMGIDRQSLFTRFAQGATNAAVAKEFGLSQRQVQGFRMQMARPRQPESAGIAEEVVRFVRQEGDVVVGAGENQFLVNGRFRLTFQELLERANRMRARKGKPLFPNVARAVACAIPAVGVLGVLS